MPLHVLAAATAAHGGLSQADSTSFQRYEERVSSVPAIIPRHIDPDDTTTSSKITTLPPLTNAQQPLTSDSTTNFVPPPAPVPRRPGFAFLHRRPSGASAEPGVNPLRDSSIAKYSHYKQECLIDVIDYDVEDASIERLGNEDFINMMNRGYSKNPSDNGPDQHPKAVRWINIGGIDWDVLSALAPRHRTVISIMPTANLNFTALITERLHHSQSVLRTSEDASLLLQSLLDLVADRILEVVDEYQMKIHKLEHDIMLSPRTDSVRSLHVLSGDLIMHKLMLEPIKTMIYNLRRYDVDRCIAMANHIRAEASPIAEKVTEKVERMRWETAWTHMGVGKVGDKWKVRGYLSFMCRIYLGDVCDHMDFALTSLDTFAGIAENLIDYAFNMASYDMNQVMNRLTIVTIIFLPLILLTGYFGMNFVPFSSLDGHSEIQFWRIAIPAMAALISLFMFQDIANLIKYVSRKWRSTRAAKVSSFCLMSRRTCC
ncbi:Magnesium transport protein CorA [Leucoagaricus sp. SymC.cos]|nr:Magnesium transport protein CorA [Leucoagaricus sp. SymC.cos]